jgi:peptidoglycan/LPS O-acetylase OafA/YrhL
MDISNFYLACAWGLAFFMLMLVPAALSYHFIELPFFRFRRNYLRSSQALEES